MPVTPPSSEESSFMMTESLFFRVGIKPGFYHKAQPGGFNGFYEGGFLGFYVGFINLEVYH